MSKNISIKLSGIKESGNDVIADGRLKCKYIYVSSDDNANVPEFPKYGNIIPDERENNPILINFTKDNEYGTERYNGIYALSNSGNSYSFYRREYEIYYKTYYDPEQKKMIVEEQKYVGEWKPVAVKYSSSMLRDFNIKSGHSYQYILYPNYTSQKQQFALSTDHTSEELKELKQISYKTGDIFRTSWDEWSLTELIPVQNEVNAPIVNKTYKADINNVWLFKYNLETGTQAQNLSKNEIDTLGQFPKIGYGLKNYISGDVSCLLGSEIIPYSRSAYIERMRNGISKPLSTNEKMRMLNQWRAIVSSKNPKLLKDIKGQSWIVQIFSGSNTPHNFYKNQPDNISFSWKQIEDTENCIIYGAGDVLPEVGCPSSEWIKESEFNNILK